MATITVGELLEIHPSKQDGLSIEDIGDEVSKASDEAKAILQEQAAALLAAIDAVQIAIQVYNGVQTAMKIASTVKDAVGGATPISGPSSAAKVAAEKTTVAGEVALNQAKDAVVDAFLNTPITIG